MYFSDLEQYRVKNSKCFCIGINFWKLKYLKDQENIDCFNFFFLSLWFSISARVDLHLFSSIISLPHRSHWERIYIFSSFSYVSNLYTQHRAWSHNSEIKSHILLQLSRPSATKEDNMKLPFYSYFFFKSSLMTRKNKLAVNLKVIFRISQRTSWESINQRKSY